MADQTAILLRELPSIDRLLNHARCAALLICYNRDYITQKYRAALDQVRGAIRQGKAPLLSDETIIAVAEVLTPHQREVLLTVVAGKVPLDVLAERRGTTRGALYKTIHDARRKLRAHLADAGLLAEEVTRR